MLKSKYKRFVAYLISLNEKEFLFAPEYKCSASQPLDHIERAVSPLVTGLLLLNFLISLVFGKAKGKFIPKEMNVGDKQKNIVTLLKLVALLIKNVNGFSENQLATTYLLIRCLAK